MINILKHYALILVDKCTLIGNGGMGTNFKPKLWNSSRTPNIFPLNKIPKKNFFS